MEASLKGPALFQPAQIIADYAAAVLPVQNEETTTTPSSAGGAHQQEEEAASGLTHVSHWSFHPSALNL